MHLPAVYLAQRDEETGGPFVELASPVHSPQGRTVDRAVMVVGNRTQAETGENLDRNDLWRWLS